MYRVRFHGRGGQGVKTASRILGSALFAEGFEVQDAPRYGAERRGAPMFAYVRAAREPICERGVIRVPDLVIVTDQTLIPVPVAGVMAGVAGTCVLLVDGDVAGEEWQRRLATRARVVQLPPAAPAAKLESGFVGARAAGAAARLLGVVGRSALEAAIREELEHLGAHRIAQNVDQALRAYDALAPLSGCVREGQVERVDDAAAPDWIDVPLEMGRAAAPAMYAGATSVEVKTGLWRTLRPVIDPDRCKGCWWICSTYCPDGAIPVQAGRPSIDYDHCKGCLICVVQCPSHAIEAVPERGSGESDHAGSREVKRA